MFYYDWKNLYRTIRVCINTVYIMVVLKIWEFDFFIYFLYLFKECLAFKPTELLI